MLVSQGKGGFPGRPAPTNSLWPRAGRSNAGGEGRAAWKGTCLAQLLPCDPKGRADAQGSLEMLDGPLSAVRSAADLPKEQRTVRRIRRAITDAARRFPESAGRQCVLGVLQLSELERADGQQVSAGWGAREK